VYLIGNTFPEIGGSEYLQRVHTKVAGKPPQLDLVIERKTQDAILKGIHAGLVHSCHDISDGGLAVALAECCILDKNHQLGLEATIESDLQPHLLAFSESQSRFLISISDEHKLPFEEIFRNQKIPVTLIGIVSSNLFSLNNWFEYSVQDLSTMYFETIAAIMNQEI
jgi:phosphoribosylformylglycinamidine synthase